MERTYISLIQEEFEQEVHNTRRLLQALPTEELTFKVTTEGWTMGQLAQHIVNIYHWCAELFTGSSYELTQDPYQPADPNNKAQLLAHFEANVEKTRKILQKMHFQEWEETWTMRIHGNTIVPPSPKITLLRGFLFNHLVHHRGELIVYLRAAGHPVPGLYGPTREEMPA
jgi:uncharacterized damage-inducible protein DinB